MTYLLAVNIRPEATEINFAYIVYFFPTCCKDNNNCISHAPNYNIPVNTSNSTLLPA